MEEVRNNVAIYSHTLLRIHVIGGQRSVRIGPPCLLITAVQQPGTSSPPSRLKRSSTDVIWMCKASFTNNSCPLPWSSTVVSSQWIGWWCSHACSATADFSIIPLSQASRCSFSLVSSLRNASAPPKQETADVSSPEEEQEKGPLVVIPYVAGMSEDIRRVCRKFNIRVVFKSGRTLRSMLTKVKDTLPLGKQSNVVYRIPCSCGQVYIGETKRRLETRLKEHRDACERGMMEKSAVAEHAWEHHHPIHWEETTVLDHGRGQELLVKEALHIQMTPVEERFNRDGGLEVPGCWTAVMRKQGGRSNPHRPLTSNDVHPQ